MGISYEDLTGLAISVSGATSNDALVATVWQNLFGIAPTAAEIAPFVALLDNGDFSQIEFTTIVADIDLNLINIDLAGLSQTGLEYIPFA